MLITTHDGINTEQQTAMTKAESHLVVNLPDEWQQLITSKMIHNHDNQSILPFLQIWITRFFHADETDVDEKNIHKTHSQNRKSTT